MKRCYFLLLAITIPLCFNRCSWVENFTVGNLSNEAVFVSYKLEDLHEGMTFGIFTPKPTFYAVKPKGGIDWNKSIQLTDTDTSALGVSVSLPPNTVMIFGTLHNDTYESAEQYFINGRDFNFDFMEVEVNLEVHHITKETFDQHFEKKNGFIRFDIH